MQRNIDVAPKKSPQNPNVEANNYFVYFLWKIIRFNEKAFLLKTRKKHHKSYFCYF